MTIKHGSLFSGIGGFDLAAEWMGWENVFHCEWNSFGQKVLNYYWPNAESFTDITKTNFKKYANKIDILTGGFPCQPFSLAGKRQGQDDDRYLWHEMLRAIQEIKPTFVVAENVYGITNIDGGLVFEQVCLDLETEGYEVQPFIIPACAKDAPHRRDRVWFVAYSNINDRRSSNRESRCEESKTNRKRQQSVYTGFGTTSNEGTTSDSESEGGGGLRNESEKERTQGGNELFGKCSRIYGDKWLTPDAGLLGQTKRQEQPMGVEQLCKKRNAPDSCDKGLQGCEQHGTFNERHKSCESHKPIAKLYKSNNWQHFPTQPPIRGGDDGLSSKLVGITVSKHRNESIKAYGNAIVPQIAYEIFKQLNQLIK